MVRRRRALRRGARRGCARRAPPCGACSRTPASCGARAISSREPVVDVRPTARASTPRRRSDRRHLDRAGRGRAGARRRRSCSRRAIGAMRVPTRKRAASSIGCTVAERPMRSGRCSHSASSRASESIRWLPRLSRISACSSSTITVRTLRSSARLRSAVSIRYSDSGVVMRMCGASRRIAARAACVVSPVRSAVRISGGSMPSSRATSRMPAERLHEVALDVAAQRLQRRDVDDVDALRQLAGEPALQQRVDAREERRQRLAGARRRGDQRVAAPRDGAPAGELRVGGARRSGAGTSRGRRDGMRRVRSCVAVAVASTDVRSISLSKAVMRERQKSAHRRPRLLTAKCQERRVAPVAPSRDSGVR